MSDCLVTTLKESVTDNSLLKIGQLRLHYKASAAVARLSINVAANSNDTTLTIEGDRYWTDSTGTDNYGKVRYGAAAYEYISAGPACDVLIDEKYNLVTMNMSGGLEADLSDFDYITKLDSFKVEDTENIITGKLDDFVANHNGYNSNGMASLVIGNTSTVKGDISCLKKYENRLENINFINNTGVEGDFSVFDDFTRLSTINLNGANKIYGNISDVSSSTLVNLYVEKTRITGTLSSIANNYPELVRLNVSNTAITGDTSDLSSLTGLTTFNYTNTAITGTWPLT